MLVQFMILQSEKNPVQQIVLTNNTTHFISYMSFLIEICQKIEI